MKVIYAMVIMSHYICHFSNSKSLIEIYLVYSFVVTGTVIIICHTDMHLFYTYLHIHVLPYQLIHTCIISLFTYVCREYYM